jgi:ABC-type bacteriocin/lantibiotic exporter with double-glycine peptidase domain
MPISSLLRLLIFLALVAVLLVSIPLLIGLVVCLMLVLWVYTYFFQARHRRKSASKTGNYSENWQDAEILDSRPLQED